MNTGIPSSIQPVRPFFGEGSGLRSPRDGDSLTNGWKKHRKLSSNQFSQNMALLQMSATLKRQRRRVLGMPPIQQQALPLHPFKVYAPSNVSTFVGETALFFQSAVGSVATCMITAANVPTNLAANPPTVSVADTWRFFAVRSGAIEIRTNYTNPFGGIIDINNLTYAVSEGNNAMLYIAGGSYLANTGGGGTITPDGTDGYITPFDSTETSPVTLCVMGQVPDPNATALMFSIWITLLPDTTTFPYPGAVVQCLTQNFYGDIIVPNFPAMAQNALCIPIATGWATPDNLGEGFSAFSVAQYQFNHVYRFPPGNGNFAASVGTAQNQRGLCQDFSAISSGLVYIEPADLASQLFYPGDCVYAAQAASETGYNYWGIYQFVGAAPAFPQTYTVSGTKLISPWSDANFKITYIDSGADNLFLG